MFAIEEGSEAMRYLRRAMSHVPSKVSFDERANGVAIKVGEGTWTAALGTASPYPSESA